MYFIQHCFFCRPSNPLWWPGCRDRTRHRLSDVLTTLIDLFSLYLTFFLFFLLFVCLFLSFPLSSFWTFLSFRLYFSHFLLSSFLSLYYSLCLRILSEPLLLVIRTHPFLFSADPDPPFFMPNSAIFHRYRNYDIKAETHLVPQWKMDFLRHLF